MHLAIKFHRPMFNRS